MNTAQKPIESLNSWLLGSSKRLTLGDPEWLTRQRRHARERLRKEPVPGPRQEGWRYTNLRPLLEQRFRPVAEAISTLDDKRLQNHLIPNLDVWRVVLVNGRFDPELSKLEGLPAGTKAASLRQLLTDDPELIQNLLNRVAGGGAHAFATLNTAGLHDGFLLHLARGTRLEKPIELIHVSLGRDEPRLVQPRHLVKLETNAEATLIERYLGPDESLYCINNMLEIDLEPGSRLAHHRVQEESPNAFHLSGLYIRQGGHSLYHGTNVALGAAWSRTDIKLSFAAPGAECEIEGLYLAGDGQLVDFHLDIQHEVPECSSREHFKGLVSGKGRAVLDGRVHVAVEAQKTNAHLKIANLLLSRNAEVDTKPQLEIHADDVKCSHGATVGQIDSDALFYLRTRGIPELEARRILCVGFAGEIIQSCGPSALQEYIEARVNTRLSVT